MARRLRLHVPDGCYHVTLRGNHREPIFFERSDRALLDYVVGDTVSATGLRIHAYCWMTNHLHMLAQVADEPLGRSILRIASLYARKVQRRFETTGHLFERRYRCVIVDADRYLQAVVRYIHLNPVDARLVADPADYPWSSHRNYLGRAGAPWVTTEFTLGRLGSTREESLAAYRKLMRMDTDGAASATLPVNRKFHGVLGDDDFAKRIAAQAVRPLPSRSLDELMVACTARFGLSEDQLASPSKARPLSLARAWLAHEVVAEKVTSISALARRLGRSEAALRQLLARHPQRPEGPG